MRVCGVLQRGTRLVPDECCLLILLLPPDQLVREAKRQRNACKLRSPLQRLIDVETGVQSGEQPTSNVECDQRAEPSRFVQQTGGKMLSVALTMEAIERYALCELLHDGCRAPNSVLRVFKGRIKAQDGAQSTGNIAVRWRKQQFDIHFRFQWLQPALDPCASRIRRWQPLPHGDRGQSLSVVSVSLQCAMYF